jgi:hypothetical protein
MVSENDGELEYKVFPSSGLVIDPEVVIDKQGKQQHKFKPDQHTIAVKVVDNDDLDNIELIRLKVNGTVERS